MLALDAIIATKLKSEYSLALDAPVATYLEAEVNLSSIFVYLSTDASSVVVVVVDVHAQSEFFAALYTIDNDPYAV